MIKNYTRIKLTTNKYEHEGVYVGMLGYIIELYHDGKYEVEFSDTNGITVAQLVLDESDFVVSPE